MSIDSYQFVLSQLLAGLALAIDIYAFSRKNRDDLLQFFALACFLGGLHFLALGQLTAFCLVMITTVRVMVARRYPQKRWAALFLVIQSTTAWVTYRSPVSLLSFSGSFIGTIASFQPGLIRMRLLYLLASSLWVVHNCLVWTPVGIVAEIVFIIANARALRRDYLLMKSATP